MYDYKLDMEFEVTKLNGQGYRLVRSAGLLCLLAGLPAGRQASRHSLVNFANFKIKFVNCLDIVSGFIYNIPEIRNLVSNNT